LIINEENSYIDVLNNQKNKIVWSVNYFNKKNPESKYLSSRVISTKTTLIGVVLETKAFKIFNKEKLLTDFISE